jgi:hypothetical protein
MSPGIFAQMQRSEGLLNSAIGMFKGDVGDQGPERTGAAIRERQKPGDVATYAFFDNLARSIAHSAKIILGMIPKLYDTERDVRIRNVDETESFVPVNTTVGDALSKVKENPERYHGMSLQVLENHKKKSGEHAAFNDLTVGKYDVVVTVGPSYATQREEASEAMLRLVQANPKLMAIAGDIIVGNLDVKDADKLAHRLEKTLPPGMIEPKQGEAPPQPLPPSPQMQMVMSKMENEKEKHKTEQIKQQKELLRIKLEMIKIYKETKETDKAMRSEILKVLMELHGMSHPADSMMDEGTQQPPTADGLLQTQ